MCPLEGLGYADLTQLVENGSGLTLVVNGAFAFKPTETEPWRPRTTTLSG
jgi:hypothetical protein